MLLASTAWMIPQTAHAKTKTRPPEANIEIKQELPTHANALPPQTNSMAHKPIKERPTPNIQRTSMGQREFSGRDYSKEEVKDLIIQYSAQYGINPDAPLCIAKLESGYNQHSKNKSSSASGVFQYLMSTWSGTDEGRQGLSVFNADANVKAAIKYMASRKSTKPWVVGKNCPQVSLTSL